MTGNEIRVGDLLISVTTFFRDPKAFEALAKQVIPRVLEGKKPSDSSVRGFPGVPRRRDLRDRDVALGGSRSPRCPSADPGFGALAVAWEGLYPIPIEAAVSEERLGRFFTKQDGHYRVRRELREVLHELATNAAKYGSLTGETGTVHFSWRLCIAQRLLTVAWEERGGPAVTEPAPTNTSLGNLLIHKGLPFAKVRHEFDPQGVTSPGKSRPIRSERNGRTARSSRSQRRCGLWCAQSPLWCNADWSLTCSRSPTSTRSRKLIPARVLR